MDFDLDSALDALAEDLDLEEKVNTDYACNKKVSMKEINQLKEDLSRKCKNYNKNSNLKLI